MSQPVLDRVCILALAAALAATPALGVDFSKGKVRGSWDTTFSFGVSVRLDDPDSQIIGIANGGTAFSVNGDDGNLNYDTGVFSMTPKVTSELELEVGEHFGAFIRGSSFYDIENEDGDRQRTPLGSAALDRVGSRTDLLDAYIRFRFDIGDNPAEIRVGQQVISWGESTFIQNSINTINPIEVSAIRVPGAELREALLPEGLVWFNLGTSQNTSLELFYQYRWNDTEIDPPGSYFSGTDLAGDGASVVFLGFGDSRDTPPFSDPTDPTRPFLGVPRSGDMLPDDGGQYGAAFRWFVPALNGTEFGLYYINYHSRLPTINAVTGSLTGAIAAATIGAATTPIATEVLNELNAAIGDMMLDPGEIDAAIVAGVMEGLNAGASPGAAQGIAGATGLTFAGTYAATMNAGASTTAGQAAAATAGTAFATDAYAQTASYFLAYLEDVELWGLSFNTQLGTSGIALQGEISYRMDVPLQVDDVELLFAALAPINPVLAGNSGIPGEPGASQLATFRNEDYSMQFETVIPGFIRRDVIQPQVTATKIFGHALGADQSVIIGEVALTHVEDMPTKGELRLEGAGTYVSGNAYHQVGTNPGAAHAGKTAESSDRFADASSWGYRVAGRLTYNNALGAINLMPSLSFQHDVNGNSPGPGGNFIEDRKALTLGLGGTYQNTWSAELSYTRYFGAGRYNLINDRDFIAGNVKFSF